MKRITILSTALEYGGAEIQVIQLASGLQAKGWLVQLISMVKPVVDIEALIQEGIQVETLNMKKGIPDPRAIWRLRRFIKSFSPQIVHSHMIHANLLARVCRLITSMPVLVSTAHNTNEGGKLSMWLYRITDPLCDLTTNVSQEAVQSYIHKRASPKDKIIFIPNGINLQKFKPSSDGVAIVREELGLTDEFMWLAIGRLTEAKDYSTLLKAWQKVSDLHSGGRLFIVGDGNLRAELEALAADFRLNNSVKFLGIRIDVPRLMNASDAYVMSSLWEGMPMVLLEAASCELPIVATDVGGNREVVIEGISGYLAEPANPENLAVHMLAMMNLSVEERLEMGRSAREYVQQHYELDLIIARWESLYSDLLRSEFQVVREREHLL